MTHIFPTVIDWEILLFWTPHTTKTNQLPPLCAQKMQSKATETYSNAY